MSSLSPAPDASVRSTTSSEFDTSAASPVSRPAPAVVGGTASPAGTGPAANLDYAAAWTEGSASPPSGDGGGGFSFLPVLGAILRAEALARQPEAKPVAVSTALRALEVEERRLLEARVAEKDATAASILQTLTGNLRVARETLLAAADAEVQRRLGRSFASAPEGTDEGSMLYVAATSEDTIAYDRGGYAQAVTKDLAAPAADVRATMERWASATFDPVGYNSQSPTLVQTGAGAASDRPGGRRVGVYVANSQYDKLTDLKSPVTDTAAIKGQMETRGYQNIVHPDKSAEEMTKIYEGAATEHGLTAGDSLFLYYSGHGIRQGLLGVHSEKLSAAPGHNEPEYKGDLYEHAHLNAATRAATSRGIHTTVLVDACYSGEGASQMRRLEMAELAVETKGTDLAALNEIARKIDGSKRRFGGVSLNLHAEKIGADFYGEDAASQANAKLLVADLVADISALARQFESATGQPLASLKRLSELRGTPRSFDIIDDLTNEVLAYIHAKQLAAPAEKAAPSTAAPPSVPTAPSELDYAAGWVDGPAGTRGDVAPITPVQGIADGFAFLPALTAILHAKALANVADATAKDVSQALAALDLHEEKLLQARVEAGDGKQAPELLALNAQLRGARESLWAAADAQEARRVGASFPRPPAGSPEGRMLSVSSTTEDMVATDFGGYTAHVNLDLSHPFADVTDTLTRWAGAELNSSGSPWEAQYPTLVQSGSAVRGGTKYKGVLLANRDYTHLSDLAGAASDAAGFAARIEKRGFETVNHADKTGAEMKALFDGAANDGELGAGDSLVLYYAGHSIRQGLLGVNAERRSGDADHNEPAYTGDLYEHAHLNAATRTATSRGINTTVVVDACYAGEGVAQLRRLEMGELAEETRGNDLSAVTEVARRIDGAKRRFGGIALRQQARAINSDHTSSNRAEAARGALLFGDFIAEMGALAREFEALTGTPLKSAKRLPDVKETYVRSFDVIDDLTNEVIAYVQGKQLAKSKEGEGGATTP